jgi:hypothetical protein
MAMGQAFQSELRTIKLSQSNQKSCQGSMTAQIDMFAVIIEANQDVRRKCEGPEINRWGHRSITFGNADRISLSV